MRSRICLQWDYIFGDHFAECSHQAKLYYIKLLFFADRGFVSSPLQVLGEMGYDKSVLWELMKNGEVLAIEGRSEIFITSYFIHNKFNPKSWLESPFSVYWKGKLWIKENGVATFKPQGFGKKKEPEPPIPQPEVDKPEELDDDENIDLPWEELIKRISGEN